MLDFVETIWELNEWSSVLTDLHASPKDSEETLKCLSVWFRMHDSVALLTAIDPSLM